MKVNENTEVHVKICKVKLSKDYVTSDMIRCQTERLISEISGRAEVLAGAVRLAGQFWPSHWPQGQGNRAPPSGMT